MRTMLMRVGYSCKYVYDDNDAEVSILSIIETALTLLEGESTNCCLAILLLIWMHSHRRLGLRVLILYVLNSLLQLVMLRYNSNLLDYEIQPQASDLRSKWVWMDSVLSF